MTTDLEEIRTRLDAAPESKDSVALNLIDGGWGNPTGEILEAQFDPSLGEQTGWLRHASLDDVNLAVASAVRARSDAATEDRASRLLRVEKLRTLIAKDRSAFVTLLVREVGKPIAQAEQELDLADAYLDWVVNSDPQLTVNDRGGRVAHRPIGVAAGISLYHYAIVSPLWMAIPALLAGNAYVLRPCTWSPATGAALGRLIGTCFEGPQFNLVHGGIEVVDRLLDHPDVAAISYVGSGPWAGYMHTRGAASGKRVQSMGAIRQVHIVLAGADVDAAARSIASALLEYAGQRWLGGSTVIADPATSDVLIAPLLEEMSRARTGPAFDTASDMGPVVREQRRNDLFGRIESLDPGQVLLDGRLGIPSDGYFLGPTVAAVTSDSDLWRDEVPGPILSFIRADAAAVVDLLRTSSQGLVGSIYGPARAVGALAPRVPLSMIGLNRALGEIPPGLPFSGWSPGFFGAEHWNGPDQARFFTHPQVIVD